jgi:hypothetical protein
LHCCCCKGVAVAPVTVASAVAAAVNFYADTLPYVLGCRDTQYLIKMKDVLLILL